MRAAKRPCTHPGCGVLTDTGRCEAHRRALQRETDARRGNSAQRGYGGKWRKEREAWLRAHPLCECEQCQGGRVRVTPASVVDHRTPHRGDMRLFWDRKNWQSMSKACHDRKTATQDGGFGRGPGQRGEAKNP